MNTLRDALDDLKHRLVATDCLRGTGIDLSETRCGRNIMNFSLTFKKYLAALGESANEPLSLELMLRPFQLSVSSVPAADLLMGHLLDALQEEFEDDRKIDSMDVAAVAYDLGYDGAGIFLDEAPNLLFQKVLEGAIKPVAWSLPDGPKFKYPF
jgi:hypothetical protein